MSKYPKQYLYEYPAFFLKKLSRHDAPEESIQKAIDDVTSFMAEYSNQTMNDSIVEKFFQIESVTPDLISYVRLVT